MVVPTMAMTSSITSLSLPPSGSRGTTKSRAICATGGWTIRKTGTRRRLPKTSTIAKRSNRRKSPVLAAAMIKTAASATPGAAGDRRNRNALYRDGHLQGTRRGANPRAYGARFWGQRSASARARKHRYRRHRPGRRECHAHLGKAARDRARIYRRAPEPRAERDGRALAGGEHDCLTLPAAPIW